MVRGGAPYRQPPQSPPPVPPVALPAAGGAVSSALPAAAAPAAGAGGPLGLRVLFADDEEVNRRLGARMLGRLGCDVALLDDGDGVAGAVALRDHLADAAYRADWPAVMEVLAAHPELVNASRLPRDPHCPSCGPAGYPDLSHHAHTEAPVCAV